MFIDSVTEFSLLSHPSKELVQLLRCLQFVNGHSGNHYLRQLAVARKSQFDAGSYMEKRALATEIVAIIKNLKPPARFLCKLKATRPPEGQAALPPSPEGEWVELDLERSIHKACQVMRDIDRQDRKDRDERRRVKKIRSQGMLEAVGSVKDAEPEVAAIMDEGSVGEESAAEVAVNAAEIAVEEAIAAIDV